MPVLSWAHSQYWATHAEEPPVTPPGASRGGYPQWQTSILCNSGFGFMQVAWDWLNHPPSTTATVKKER